jgi:hypothetical protein
VSTAVLAKRTLVEPDYWTCPHGVRVRPTSTYGPAVADLCDKAGFTPDPQQELGLDLVFAIRPDGSPASFSFCIICARQNLKSGLFLQCVIGWLFVIDVPEIAWSAHELKTSLDAQDNLFEILESPALSKYLPTNKNHGMYDQNGKERQELTTGQTVWFQTRTRDGGRGLGKPKVIIDEAFKFKARTAGALLPILLAQHHPQLLYGSSAPPLDPDAATLRDLIDRGRGRKSPELSYLEWLAKREPCADPDCRHPKDALARGIDCALDRVHLLLQANPTVDRDDQGRPLDTGRITIGTLRNLRQEMPPEEYMRECLGWSEEAGDAKPRALNLQLWNHESVRLPKTPAPTRAAVVLDVEPDLSAASIGVAGGTTDGRTMVMDWHGSVAEVVSRLVELKSNIEMLEVALHPSSAAGELMPELIAEGFEVHPLVLNDLGRGCAGFQNGVKALRFVHLGQLELDAAVSAARTRKSAQLQLWDRENSPVPLGPLVSTSTAAYRYSLLTAKPDTPPPAPVKASAAMARRRPTDDVANVGF